MNNQIKQQVENLICKPLIGLSVPTNQGGHAGREVETILENMGVPIKKGAGADITIQVTLLGIKYFIEVKTRDKDATSPHTVGTIHADNLSLSYEDSNIWEKLQYQIRIATKDNVIVKAELYDFTRKHIQDKFKEAYEYGVKHIIANQHCSTTPIDGHWAYFERKSAELNSFQYRLSKNDMPAIERMAKTVDNLFEEV
jgi:translation initiation factor IF-1